MSEPRLPPNEHEVKETIEIDVYYPDHPPRMESAVFRKTVADGKHAGTRCCVSGDPHPEYHHVFIEWADAEAVNWVAVQKQGLRSAEALAQDGTLLGWILALTKLRGFDWTTFDPAKPEQFVDSPQNMIPLAAKYHRLKDHGIHMLPFPIFIMQAWPRAGKFVFSPDEAPGS